ncbi:MAG: transcription termination factor NusA, partial [Duncaniella sp.]|nr:transcription termination factor NusA [Duncaniella sp.]
LDLQKEAVYAKFKELEGELVSGEVYQTWSRETLLLDDEKNELLLPKNESIPGDFFRKGETVLAVIANVDNKNNNPKITVSRTNEAFLRRLFEREVPEIVDGLISIRAVARIPGERAKIAVESFDDRIDPVGACVGVKGSRIHGIVRELRNENIDVINYTSNPQLFIQRALSPAKISNIHLDEEEKKAEVFLHPEEVSLAIGKGGLNIKLASMLTGYVIDVYRDTPEEIDEDIYLDEFKDEIDGWVIDALKDMGCITAKSVLKTPRQELIDRADLEEDTVDNVIRILRAEFEDEDTSAAPAQPPAPAETAEEASVEDSAKESAPAVGSAAGEPPAAC